MRVKLIFQAVLAGMIFLASSISVSAQDYKYKETIELVGLVQNAAALLESKGSSSFNDFKSHGTQWLHGETYVFVLDKKGNMLCHPDSKLEGKNQFNLADINGRLFIQQMVKEAMDHRKNNQGWVSYLWPRPGRIFPVWKSAYVKQAVGPYGDTYVVGSGLYEMKPEKPIIEDDVADAVFLIEAKGDTALKILRDKNNGVIFGNVYLFVDDKNGVELINPVFPEVVGKNLMSFQDSTGKYVVRDYIDLADKQGSGWIEYMWPKPEEDIPSKKSTFVKKANYKDGFLVAGCGLYLDESSVSLEASKTNSVQLISFVRKAADLVKSEGEKAFSEFRKRGSPWFTGDDYIFVWGMDGKRIVYPPDPSIEGVDVSNLMDSRGRNIGQMCFNAVKNPSGEGWAHYEWIRPGAAYLSWKSNYLKKVKAPSGKEYIVASGVFSMKPDEAVIVDRVEKAADLLKTVGKSVFMNLRDKLGEFVYLDNYVFVDDMNGVELVNAGFPNLEGQNLMDTQDSNGKKMVYEYIQLADKQGSGWVDYMWPKPGTDEPAHKKTYVKKVKVGDEYFVVGSGAFFD